MAATARIPSGNPSHISARDALTAGDRPPMGLRERKKLKTRIAIRRATYRLIAERGYEATTVEQIAEAAEVSPSTVFRYFPTKEDIVLSDEYAPVLEARLRARPLDEDPLESLLHVFRESLSSFASGEAEEAGGVEEVAARVKLLLEVPAVRARVTEAMAATAQVLVRALADRTGRDRDDIGLRVFTAAVMGALREVVVVWAERGRENDVWELVDEARSVLRGGGSGFLPGALPPDPQSSNAGRAGLCNPSGD
ncbi:TetR/AcrR family transcriptional regulator [Streptomyces sp. NPDC051018]|uniref:TetR/AcrR family transcriptional regulator n=1 Tax=Streptomyces sp. NPDC051018 TaxID=3365639 RepID=UPI003798CBE8